MVGGVLRTFSASVLCSVFIVAQVRDVPGADRAIDAGIASLLKHQAADGTWKGPDAGVYRSMTGLALYTLIKCGFPTDHPSGTRI
jgi:hypothetical protein